MFLVFSIANTKQTNKQTNKKQSKTATATATTIKLLVLLMISVNNAHHHHFSFLSHEQTSCFHSINQLYVHSSFLFDQFP